MDMILSCLGCIFKFNNYHTMDCKLNNRKIFQKTIHQTNKKSYIQPKPINRNNYLHQELDDDVGLTLIVNKYFFCFFIIYHCILYVFGNTLSY